MEVWRKKIGKHINDDKFICEVCKSESGDMVYETNESGIVGYSECNLCKVKVIFLRQGGIEISTVEVIT